MVWRVFGEELPSLGFDLSKKLVTNCDVHINLQLVVVSREIGLSLNIV